MSERSGNPHRRYAIAASFLAAPLFMALNLVLARHLRGAVPPFTLSFLRWAIACVVLLPFARQGLAALRGPERGVLVLLAFFGGAVTVGPQYLATTMATAGDVAMIFSATPIFVMLIERLVYGVRLTPVLVLGAVLGLVGIALTGFDLTIDRSMTALAGDGIAIVGALGWGGYSVVMRRHQPTAPPLALLWVVAFGGAIFLAVPAAAEIVLLGAFPHLLPSTLLLVVGLALVASIGVYWTYGKLVVLVGASMAGTSMFLVPPYALAGGALILGDPIGAADLVSLTFILAGVSVPLWASRTSGNHIGNLAT